MDGTLRLDAEGASAVLKLGLGGARLRFVDQARAGTQYVQLELDDGATRAHVWGMVALWDMKLVGREIAPRAQGLMVATSMSPLCRWLAPYLAKG